MQDDYGAIRALYISLSTQGQRLRHCCPIFPKILCLAMMILKDSPFKQGKMLPNLIQAIFAAIRLSTFCPPKNKGKLLPNFFQEFFPFDFEVLQIMCDQRKGDCYPFFVVVTRKNLHSFVVLVHKERVTCCGIAARFSSARNLRT